MNVYAETVGTLWLKLLEEVFLHGAESKPRGLAIRERIKMSAHLELPEQNIFIHPERDLNYRFMVAEWLWIFFGHDDVKTIEQYNKQIAKFSDDGLVFTGAYGPHVRGRWAEVEDLLRRDPDTRQAVIDIFGGRPTYKTKDVPCTISLQFLLRQGRLETIVTMRSQDMWLGFPYDIFNFTMLANTLAATLKVGLGPLQLNVGSAHVYETNFKAVTRVLDSRSCLERLSSPILTEEPTGALDVVLCVPGVALKPEHWHEPWLTYARVLSGTRTGALPLLRTLK